jgi:enoyl-CoA hydratase/carnithine racemase
VENRIFGNVTLTADGHVAIVEFSNPPLNFFNEALLRDLASAFAAADADDALRSILLASAGKAFCAGADFGDGTAIDPEPLYAQGAKLFAVRKPVVAAVQGATIGGGLGLALIADFRVASAETRLAANFVKIGIHPGFGLTHTLPRLVGHQKAAELLLTGRRISGTEAVAIGLIDVLAEQDELRARALALASEIAEGAPLAVESTRATLRRGLTEALAAQLEIEVREQRRLFQTRDFKEGVAAVTERRTGNWLRH